MKRMITSLIVLGMAWVFVSSAVAVQDGAPILAAVRCASAPTLDGDISDSCWEKAAHIERFVAADTGKLVREQTEAWVCYDRDNLYIAVKCHESEISAIKSAVKEHGGPVHRDDSIEIFLDPWHRKTKPYYHFQVNSIGSRSAKIMRWEEPEPWNADWQVKTRIYPEYWSVEIAVPFSIFECKEEIKNVWGVNLCRNRRVSPEEFSCFIPTYGSFHSPERFGELNGIDVDFRKYVYVFGSPVIVNERCAATNCAYAVGVNVKHVGKTASPPLTLEISDCPRQIPSERTIAMTGLCLQAGEQKFVNMVVNSPVPGKRHIRLRLFDAVNGEVYCHATVSYTPSAMMQSYLQRSYYTDEKTALVISEPAFRQEPGAKYILRINVQRDGEAGNLIGLECDIHDGRIITPLAIEKLSNGQYRVETTLLDGDGVVMCRESMSLNKYPPKPYEVKIDNDSKCLLVNGKPFFPLGMYCNKYMDKNDLIRLKQVGFNTVGLNFRGADFGKTIDMVRECGLKCFFDPQHPSYADPQFVDKCRSFKIHFARIVSQLMDNPSLLWWYSFDEPNLPNKDSVLAECQDLYQEIRTRDPYHPVYINFCLRIPDIQRWRTTFDIGSIDTYWMKDSEQETPIYVARAMQQAIMIANRWRKPLFIVPQAELWSRSLRALTPAEQACQVYLALIYGAKGVVYFYYPVEYKAMWDQLARLNTQIEFLKPILLSSDAVEVPVDPGPDLTGNVHFLCKQYDSVVYIIAANSSQMKIRVRFDLVGLNAKSAIRLPFEDRRISFGNGVYSDIFSPLETHVYVISGLKVYSETGVGKLTVSASEMAKVAKVCEVDELSREAKLRSLGANLIVNPGFETTRDWGLSSWGSGEQGASAWDNNIVRAGQYSLKIINTKAGAQMNCFSDWIVLTAGTKYILRGFIKANITRGNTGPLLFATYQDADGIWRNYGKTIRLPGISVANPSGDTEWSEYYVALPMPDKNTRVKVFCALPKESLGSAWFDDLFLGKGIIEEQAGNMLYNSSFETDKVRPGTPDCWVKDLWYCLGSSAWQPLIGEEGANWCMDSEVAYHGKRSLRIQGNGVAGRYVRGCMVAPDHIYTYSAYMKSDGGSVRARLYFNKPGGDPLQPPLHKDIIVDNAWKRYHFSRKIPLGVEKVCVGFSLSDNGILWIDAVQLERGEDATPYIPVEK